VQPIHVADERLLSQDIYWMLAFAGLILPLVFLPRGLRLGWKDGVVLLAAYSMFLYLTIA
jgi:cation:H+ antiporter